MKTNVVSGATIAVAAIALAMGGLPVTSASAKSGKTVECMGINSCKGTERLQDCEQRVQGPEFL